MNVSTDLAIRKSVSVPLVPERAFELFTAGISTWWPTASHSIGGDDVAEVVFEQREGGELYERRRSGETAHWGRVTAWEPPHRLVLAWKVSPDAPATELTVTFTAENGRTRVELEHAGWERYGALAASEAHDYDGGWDIVLGRYTGAAAA